MHGAAYVGVRPCHHKQSYSTNPPGFIVYRKLKDMVSSLVNSWLKYVNWVLFCSTEAKQSKQASNHTRVSFSVLWSIRTKLWFAHHCCLQDLVEGVNQRSELFLVQNMKLFFVTGMNEWEGVVHMTLWSGVEDYAIFLTTFTWHNHPPMIHMAHNSDQNDIPDLKKSWNGLALAHYYVV